jgi:hypothetical protein
MPCDEAAGLIYAGQSSSALEVHLSACDECRALADDLAGLGRAFARARQEWAPSRPIAIPFPSIPWRRLAIAACLLVLPLAAWTAASLQSSSPSYSLGAILSPRAAEAPPSDREILATLLLEESRP